MSFGSSLDVKERVKQAVDIVDLAGKYVQLRRQGRNYVALCPWHDDSNPSLQVNPERQSWKCWVCDLGGDVFSFVMQMDGVTFPEALAMLAEQTGISIKPTQGQAKSGPQQDKRILYRAMAWAEKQYHECLLRDPEAEPARQYLQERAVSAESIEKFHLGYSPNRWDWILRRAQASGVSQKLLETVGLLAQSTERGSVYDRFRGRVLFSIRDVQGRPIALGGRVLPASGNTSPAKYINSPETPLFRKSEQLYGLDVAREAIHKSKPKVAMVMEGYTDVIIAHQYGFQNAVAVLGTALGPRHVQILKRFAEQIVLVLDGDEAGQRRTNEVLELFVSENVDLRIATLPDDLDPCDFLIEHGAAAFQEVLQSRTVDALEHAFRVATHGIDLVNDIHRASEALERLVATIAKVPRLRPDTDTEHRFRQEKILERLASNFRVPEKDVRDRLIALRRAGQQPPTRAATHETRKAAPVARPAGKMDAWQRELLELLIRYPECLPRARIAVRPDQLSFAPCRVIFEAACRIMDDGETPSFDRMMLEFEDPAVQSLLVELDESASHKKPAEPHAVMEEWIRNFQQEQAKRQTSAEVSALRQGGVDDNDTLALLARIAEQQRARQGISELTDGQDPGQV